MAAGPQFRIFGIPVRIDLTFFAIVAVLGVTTDLQFLLIWVPVVTVSVLVHELGHAVAFRAFGKQPSILLQGMGGLTSATGSLPPSHELVVSLAGPLTGLVLIGLPALWLDARVADDSSGLDLTLRILVFVNIAWSIVNLLPVLPLDGGRVTASVIHVVTRRPAEKAAHAISVVVAGAAALWAYADGQTFLAFFAAFFVAYNLGQLSHFRARRWAADVSQGYQALARDDEQEALEVGRRIAGTSSAAAVAQGLELQAWVHLRRDQPDEAEEVLRRLPPRLAMTSYLAAGLALVRGESGWLERMSAAYDDSATSGPERPGQSGQPGPWSVIAADLVARAGAVDVLAERMVTPGDAAFPGSLLELQADLHYAGRYAESTRVGERAFSLALDAGAQAHAAAVAFNVACSRARTGQAGEAMTWLERAVEHGFTDGARLEQDPDLAPLRETPEFETLREGLR